MSSSFFVANFSSDLFSAIIAQCFDSEFAEINNKKQIEYLVKYLNDLGTKTIVCERHYKDKDFSEDFANFYVKSFKDYKGYCSRLHFFTSEFQYENFKDIILKGETTVEPRDEDSYPLNSANLQEDYLGFITIKPLPYTFLGRTCLVNPSEHLLKKTYSVNLFGLPLSVKSIAFQEQDRVVSACATIAIWSLLHALPERHNKQVPSPSSITLAAIGAPYEQINGFPNKGLQTVQIITALEKYRLKHHELDLSRKQDTDQTIQYIQTYLNSKIPLLIGLNVFKDKNFLNEDETELPDANETLEFNGVKYQKIGGHAICALGHEHSEGTHTIIAHDDRVGPFVKFNVVTYEQGKLVFINNDKPNEILIPNVVLAATYPRKRIHLSPIVNTCKDLLEEVTERYNNINEKITSALDDYSLTDPRKRKEYEGLQVDLNEQQAFVNSITYRVTLVECRELKSIYAKRNDFPDKEALFDSFPHFIWRASFFHNNEVFLDFLFDGTDIPNGNSFIRPIQFDVDKSALILAPLTSLNTSNKENNINYKFVQQTSEGIGSYDVNVIRSLKPQEYNTESYLDWRFGPIRSPQYIKGHEVKNNELVKQEDVIRAFSSTDHAAKICLKGLIQENTSNNQNTIWVFDKDGALNIGKENKDSNDIQHGHPTLTGSKPARIGGELILIDEKIFINSKSGRYSGQYPKEMCHEYLFRSVDAFKEIFIGNNSFEIDICPEQIKRFIEN
jgi:hypothetical protein